MLLFRFKPLEGSQNEEKKKTMSASLATMMTQIHNIPSTNCASQILLTTGPDNF